MRLVGYLSSHIERAHVEELLNITLLSFWDDIPSLQNMNNSCCKSFYN